MAFAYFGFGELQFYLVAAVYFFESGGLFCAKLGVYGVYLFVALGQSCFEPADLVALDFVFGCYYLGHVLAVLYLAATPPLCKLDNALYAADAAYNG